MDDYDNSSMEEEAKKVISTCDEFFLFANFDDDTATTLIRTRDLQDLLSMYVEATAAALVEYDENFNHSSISKDPSSIYRLGAYFSSALFEALADRVAHELEKKKKKSRKSNQKTKIIPLKQNFDDDE